VNQYREGKVKSTAMSGVKQFLKPDAYKQSELQGSVIRDQGSEPMAATLSAAGRSASLAAAVLMTDS
jgi:hypothetical protein